MAVVGANVVKIQTPFSSFSPTPHNVDSHMVLVTILSRLTKLSSRHQPRCWLKAEALRNISCMFVTLSSAQSPMSWLKDEAPWNIFFMFVTPEVSHALMSSLKDSQAELQ